MKTSKLLKTILMIMIFFSFLQLSKANVYGTYIYEESGFDFAIQIYKSNSSYRIMLEKDILPDYGVFLYLSDGNYKLNKDTLILKDKYNNYIMKFLYKKDHLVAKKSYKCLTNKIFIKDQLLSTESSMPEQQKTNTLGEYRSSFLLKHKDYHTLKPGRYLTKGPLKLILQKNHTFLIKDTYFVFFEGKWKRNRNELQFYDKNLKHNFYSLIDHNAIILLFFPSSGLEIRMTKG